jgi:hypothetical protein
MEFQAMKFVFALAAMLALAVGFNSLAVDEASAWGCGRLATCGGVMVPTPHPIPLRKFKVRRAPCAAPCGIAVAPAPCVAPCGVAVAPVVVSPCAGPCGPTTYWYQPTRTYAFWAQPAYSCQAGMGNCYWRRDCWYDSFGRRFCN